MFKNNIFQEKIQEYLPPGNRLSGEYLPEEKWMTQNEMDIRYDEYIPEKDSNISIVMLHGVGGNGRLLSFMAVPLVRAGYKVICPDLPGYGYTRVRQTFDYSTWIEVGASFAGKEIADGRKLLLFGLSAGGMLAYNVACSLGKADGLIVTNILDNRYRKVRDYSAKNKFHSRIGIYLLGMLPGCLKKIRIPVKDVANTGAIVNQKDLLNIMLKDTTGAGSKVSIHFLLSMVHAVPLIEPEDFTVCPVLMAHPAEDRWTPVALSGLFFDRIKIRKKLVMLENAGHFPVEQPGLSQLEKVCTDFIQNATSG